MISNFKYFGCSLLALAALSSCSCNKAETEKTGSEASEEKIEAGYTFDADTAFSYVRSQVGFGPRVAGTEANRMAQKYIIGKLKDA